MRLDAILAVIVVVLAVALAAEIVRLRRDRTVQRRQEARVRDLVWVKDNLIDLVRRLQVPPTRPKAWGSFCCRK